MATLVKVEDREGVALHQEQSVEEDATIAPRKRVLFSSQLGVWELREPSGSDPCVVHLERPVPSPKPINKQAPPTKPPPPSISIDPLQQARNR